MDNCKYSENRVVGGNKHEICSNNELKKLNNSDDENIPCMGSRCGKFEERDNGQNEARK